MANRDMKHPQNVSGSYYCTSPDDADGCTACRLCYDAAPEFFAADSEGYAYVFNQPVTEDEISLCQEQTDVCPSQSIGNDG
ncbi:MAG: ferredoxin [Chlorobiaceae bacterium]|jgi:ferredoxin|nr:ferredoxin [Chlorobiaceae bacterium]